MDKAFKKINLEKGASVVELMIVLGTMSLLVGGVSVKAGDIFNQAYDVQRVANLHQIATCLQLYYLDNNSYPQVDGLTSQERWDGLISELKKGNYLATFPTKPENYDYQDLNSQGYILKVLLENPKDSLLEGSWRGEIEGVDCRDPYYCIKM